MNNYDEIAKETLIKLMGEKGYNDNIFDYNLRFDFFPYMCAYVAAKLQAERFNDDLDASYIKYLESTKHVRNK